MRPINKRQILIGGFVLLLGLILYLTQRPPDQTYFLYKFNFPLSLHHVLPKIFGPVANYLPAFIHVFAFTLITAGLLSCKKKGCLVICFTWFLIDFAFEIGQGFGDRSVAIIPKWFSDIPVLENTRAFLLRGTFDFVDLVAMALGALAAYFVFSVTMERRYTS